MRGADITQEDLISYRPLEARIPQKHPLRKLRKVVDLLLASLLQVLFSIRSERQLVEYIDFNLLYRWFVGLMMDNAVWDHSTFSAIIQRFPINQIGQLIKFMK
jgi:transposase